MARTYRNTDDEDKWDRVAPEQALRERRQWRERLEPPKDDEDEE